MRQEETRGDKRRQEETGQEETKLGRSAQEEARSEERGQEEIGQEETRPEGEVGNWANLPLYHWRDVRSRNRHY